MIQSPSQITDLTQRRIDRSVQTRHAKIGAKGPYDTVGGLLVTMLSRVPTVGDEIEVSGHRLTVVAVDGWRVQRLQVSTIEPADGISDA